MPVFDFETFQVYLYRILTMNLTFWFRWIWVIEYRWPTQHIGYANYIKWKIDVSKDIIIYILTTF